LNQGNPRASDSDFLGELRLGRYLTTTGQVAAAGLSLVTALLFLLGSPLIGLVGPAAALASLLAGIVLGLTLLSVLELLGGSGDEGGTYVLTQQTLGGLGALLVGWGILGGSAALVAALSQAAAQHVRFLSPALPLSTASIAVALFAALVLTQWLPILPSRTWRWPVWVTLLIVLSLALLTSVPRFGTPSAATTPALQPGNLMQAVGLLATAYAAFEALLASRQAIREPRRHLPRALAGNLAALVLIFVLVLLFVAGLGTLVPTQAAGLLRLLAAASTLPRWSLAWLAVALLLLGIDSALTVATAQLHQLSRNGVLPHRLLWTGQPPLSLVLLFGAVAPLTIWGSTEWLMASAAALFLVAMTLLNAAAIYSQRNQPDRRRWFVTPFPPLVPLLAIAANLALLRSLPQASLVSGALWLLLGLLIYLGYGRRHLTAAQTAECVFGPQRREKADGAYRILVPIGSQQNRRLLLNMATALACQLGGEVIPLQVIPTPDPLAIEESQHLARERNTLFQWSVRMGAAAGVPIYPITRLAHSVPQGILNTAEEEDCDLILMSWLETPPSHRRRLGRVLDPVVREAPCDVAVVAFNPADVPSLDLENKFTPVKCQLPSTDDIESGDQKRVARIVVPAAGGPHAPLAMLLASWFAREYSAATTLIYVLEPGASDADLAEAEQNLQQAVVQMREQAQLPEEVTVEGRVVRADGVVQGIVQAAAEVDLVVLGASDESLLDQVIFGSLPERVALSCPMPVVMARKYRGLSRLWLQRLWNGLYEALPKLSRRQQAEVYRALRRGARPDVDFFVMMALAAIIATFGLLQNSAAVIIGAMLVAPLFTPIISLSMAMVRSDARLLALAVESAIKGIVLAIGLGTLLALLSPLLTLTSEISSRTRPNLLDLAVALASGAAGAYALARKDVAAALPGVGIAAALVPPLCTVGIGLAMGEASVASGALLLFFTNLVAITLAGAVTLLLLGFRPARREGTPMSLRRGLLVTTMLLVLIAIPLAVVLVDSVRQSNRQRVIEQHLVSVMGEMPDAELSQIELSEYGTQIQVTAVIYARQPIEPAIAGQLSDELSQVLSRPVSVRLATIIYAEAEPALPTQ
jgi:uncharacterized hydrophobic protein (TIGR00271 family)